MEYLIVMKTIKIKNKNKTVLNSLREDFNIPLDASCGGKGTCGKCKIKILDGKTPAIDDEERKLLSAAEIEHGIRLACRITPIDELHLTIDMEREISHILEDHNGFQGDLDPIIKKKYLKLDKPVLDDQRDDISRIISAIDLKNPLISIDLRKSIPKVLRANDFQVTAVYSEGTLYAVEPGNTETENYAIACDIGTTTIVCYLLNSHTGEIIDTLSELNSQKIFGADVISRIEYAMNNDNGLKSLQEKIVSQLGNLSVQLLKHNNIDKNHFYNITLAGNTTMLHLVAGIDPEAIASAPFIPAFLGSITCLSSDLGDFPLDCEIYMLPSISAYVGADIVGGVVATSMFESEDLTLLVDLGTNGEIILGNKDQFYSCSTAAGPAFEGAHITYGTGAVFGAINTFSIKDDIGYTTIGDADASGICGSAIVDIIAEFLAHDIIEETGRFHEENLIGNEHYMSEGEGAYIIGPSTDTANGENILFTQKDIREVQLAKAAVAAGIETLIHQSQIDRKDIRHLYIAGGFGTYINKESAAAIGLIPRDLLDRAVSVGNTSGLGAINCTLCISNLDHCEQIVHKTKYIELSGSAYFQQKYMEEMIF